ncbi:MAG: IS21 family transposase [Pseudonocardiaceae bacterium]
MEILEAYDLTGCAHSAAGLAGCDPKTVRRLVELRDRGLPVAGPGRRVRLIDPFADKVEEWVERSRGKVRADVVHERLVAVGFAGDERMTRRAVAQAKARWRSGHRRTYRPWITEPGMWCQFDWGVGPMVPWAGGPARATLLFCLWLAWSRFQVVIPAWDRTLPTLLACLDTALRRLGGAPTYALTDNEKTVTVEHIARIPVRHPEIVAAGAHYGMQVATCVPFDPESKGGSEASVRIAKADLVPTEVNLLEAYPDMGSLQTACDAFCAGVNGRRHRETGAIPAERLIVERERLHVLPSAPYAAALGETRLVNTDQRSAVRVGALLHPARAGRHRGVGPRGRGRAGHRRRPGRATAAPGLGTRTTGRAGRGGPARPVHPGTAADRTIPLPWPPARPLRGAPPTGPETHQPGGDRVPRARARCRGLADRGRRRGRGPGAGEDGRRRGAGRAG